VGVHTSSADAAPTSFIAMSRYTFEVREWVDPTGECVFNQAESQFRQYHARPLALLLGCNRGGHRLCELHANLIVNGNARFDPNFHADCERIRDVVGKVAGRGTAG
jgi:hypothetical protein